MIALPQRHRDTGNYCDLSLGQWRTERASGDSHAHDCDECMPGPSSSSSAGPSGTTRSASRPSTRLPRATVRPAGTRTRPRRANYFDAYYSEIRAGQTLCLPEKCANHQVAVGDTCGTLGEKYGVTREEIIAGTRLPTSDART
ncbi:hypothetical protein B0T25DRAFT_64682 [Lasiosphaeria hispida]|uniref:LysM domain-containing protein n=1 Tax=Lasiosphaeria hispida TaxID=260671 RepID=A0AAJ0HXD6_9PEZI|nr:hypothetical protein B0T25DRAFT_64682 [Lasiosphaeria hispida]